MSAHNNGGPAFPVLERVESWKYREAHQEPEVYYIERDGMSLRDYFAAQALAGLLGSLDPGYRSGRVIAFEDEIAQDSYAIADAMLKARRGAQ